MLEHTVAERVAVVRDLSSSGVVALDRDRFRQVMVNLLDNAAQADDDQRLVADRWTPADHRGQDRSGRAACEAFGEGQRSRHLHGQPGENIRTAVHDEGLRVRLGLPTVRTIVEQHGGTIDVESKVDAGTTFVVWLPRQSGDAALPDDKEKEQAA